MLVAVKARNGLLTEGPGCSYGTLFAVSLHVQHHTCVVYAVRVLQVQPTINMRILDNVVFTLFSAERSKAHRWMKGYSWFS